MRHGSQIMNPLTNDELAEKVKLILRKKSYNNCNFALPNIIREYFALIKMERFHRRVWPLTGRQRSARRLSRAAESRMGAVTRFITPIPSDL